MSVDVHLLDGRIGGSLGRHGAVGSFIRVEGVIQSICFFEGFQLPDDTVVKCYNKVVTGVANELS